MESRREKENLSFSIENILRDDFPRGQKTNIVNVQQQALCLERWSEPPFYGYYSLRYGPIFMKCLPSVYRPERRLNRVEGEKERILTEKQKEIEEHRSIYKDEALSQSQDEITSKKMIKQSKRETCYDEKGQASGKRKRRNRSHFTQRQLQYLDKIFSRQQYLTRDERTLLARGLEMTELQIRNWFQNRRYQRKHRANENSKQDEPDSSVCVKEEV
ncbi:unnamed protein product [Pocillopora meandrina]|uniref:Homeobox domain-containing protein n=1 Tax=Pocillopora meandrina TaxID=46732 RepID=A0AAU9XFN6_9CNID|nr:unnamed protein product [Pocillopora meandrina]